MGIRIPNNLGVMLLGDTHGNFNHLRLALQTAKDAGITKVIQIGDFGFFWAGNDYTKPISQALENMDMTLDFLDGNHEDFTVLNPYTDSDEPVEIRPRIRYLPRGYTWNDGKYTYMSLGGATSVDQYDRTPGYTWFSEERITRSDVERACSRGPVDVLLLHDAPDTPHLLGKLEKSAHYWPADLLRTSAHNRMAINMVVDAVKPRLIVHGHYHYAYKAMYSNNEGHVARVIGLAQDGKGTASWVMP